MIKYYDGLEILRSDAAPMNHNVCALYTSWRRRPVDRHVERTEPLHRRRGEYHRQVCLAAIVDPTAAIVVLQQPRPPLQHDVVEVRAPVRVRAKNVHHPKSRAGEH